jgi:hypothetical protein
MIVIKYSGIYSDCDIPRKLTEAIKSIYTAGSKGCGRYCFIGPNARERYITVLPIFRVNSGHSRVTHEYPLRADYPQRAKVISEQKTLAVGDRWLD